MNLNQMTSIQYREEEDVAHVTLTASHINMKMLKELTAVCDHLEDHSSAKVVVFRGADGQFSKGIDFKEFRPEQPMDIHGFNKWEKLCVRIERLPKVTIAAMEGDVIGGGFQLALVCDSRIASPTASFQLNEVFLGFLPGMACFRLAKYIGLGRAKRIIMQCPILDAHKAESLGLVDSVFYDLEEGIRQTIDIFGPIHTVTIELARRLLNESFATDFENAIGNFLAAQHRAITQTAFLDTLKKNQKNQNGS